MSITITLACARPLSVVLGICCATSIPGVSTSVNGPKSVRTSVRVEPGRAETAESCCPLILLNSVLLPVLGRPTITTVLLRFCSTSSCARRQFTAFINPCTMPILAGRLRKVLIPSSRRLRGRSLFRKTLCRRSFPNFFFCSSPEPFLLVATLFFLPYNNNDKYLEQNIKGLS